MKRALFALACLLFAHVGEAKELTDREVSERLQFLRMRLITEGHHTHEWEAGWSLVYVGGFGYSTYELGHNTSKPSFADGLTGIIKTLVGGSRLILAPRNSSLGAHPLDEMPEDTPQDRLKKLARAENLIHRNAIEARRRKQWLPHIISAAVSIASGAIIWAAGDFYKGLQSAGTGVAAGELNIWTQPWSANGDEKEYLKNFGDFAGDTATTSTVAHAPSFRVRPGAIGLTF